MTGYLLDTNVVSEMFRRAPDRKVAEFLRERHDRLWLSVVVLHELEYGVNLLPAGRRRFRLAALVAEIAANHEARVLPVTREAARRAARLRARARRAGRPAHTGDALIAGTAEAEHLVVATRNMEHFAPFGVESVNPWTGRVEP